MTDVIELLSDSEDEKSDKNNCIDLSVESDEEPNEIVQSNEPYFYDYELNIDELPDFSILKTIQKEKSPENLNRVNKQQNLASYATENINDSKKATCIKRNAEILLDDNSEDAIAEKKTKSIEKVQQKLEKEAAKEQKRREREGKKAAIAKEKEIKKALALANKNIKPDECIKFVTCIFDTNLSSAFGPDIFSALNSTEAKISVESQIIQNSITWIRTGVDLIANNKEKCTNTTTNIEQTFECAIVMQWKELVNLIHKRKLLDHILTFQSVLSNKKIILITYGLESYFRYYKNQKNYEINTEKTKNVNSKDRIYNDEPKVSRKELEYAMTELQIMCNCSYRNVESLDEIGIVIMQITKAIAQAPYKKDKNEKLKEAEWYICGDNKDCVKVDQKGNGLKRLWQQQLTIFPLARLETADAIISKFSTPSQLMKAYDDCNNGPAKEQLLQDINIRRAAGPLTNVRRIGPELSKKVATFFTSIDGDGIL